MSVRVLHFSDVHVDVRLREVPLADWPGKRLLGAANLLLRRRREFRLAGRKLEALARFRREQEIDLVISTGDYTMLGTEGELAAARRAISALMDAPLGFVNVPGNHDLYMPDALRERRFERHFGDTLTSDLPEYQVDGPWPLVRIVGSHVAVAAVNSARPNPQPWRSSGRIPAVQLAALADVLRERRIRDRFTFVITHYAPRRRDGRLDSGSHGLVNGEDFLRVCEQVRRGAVLHGHVHHCFRVSVPGLRVPIFGGGSATCEGREGLWVFDVQADAARATRGVWTGERYALDAGERYDL